MYNAPASTSSSEDIPITRRSSWGDVLKLLGGASLLIGVILLVVGLNYNKPEQAFAALTLFVAAAVNCFFFAFLVDVFTDIRWYLCQLNGRVEAQSKEPLGQPVLPSTHPEALRRAQSMAEAAAQLKSIENIKP